MANDDLLRGRMSLMTGQVAGDCSKNVDVAGQGLSLRAGERWLCVHTAPRQEMVAAANLTLQGYRNFVPTVLKKVRHARKTTAVRSAFFPRYIFAIIDPETQAWRPINGTIGVRALVMENERPKFVPSGVVESLVEATNTEGMLDFSDDIKIGQQVRLLDGPFANFVGELARLDHRGRVAILLQVLGGERLVVAQQASLQPVS